MFCDKNKLEKTTKKNHSQITVRKNGESVKIDALFAYGLVYSGDELITQLAKTSYNYIYGDNICKELISDDLFVLYYNFYNGYKSSMLFIYTRLYSVDKLLDLIERRDDMLKVELSWINCMMLNHRHMIIYSKYPHKFTPISHQSLSHLFVSNKCEYLKFVPNEPIKCIVDEVFMSLDVIKILLKWKFNKTAVSKYTLHKLFMLDKNLFYELLSKDIVINSWSVAYTPFAVFDYPEYVRAIVFKVQYHKDFKDELFLRYRKKVDGKFKSVNKDYKSIIKFIQDELRILKYASHKEMNLLPIKDQLELSHYDPYSCIYMKDLLLLKFQVIKLHKINDIHFKYN